MVSAAEYLQVFTYISRKVKHHGVCCHLKLVTSARTQSASSIPQITHYSVRHWCVCLSVCSMAVGDIDSFNSPDMRLVHPASSLLGGVRLTTTVGMCTIDLAGQDVSENQVACEDNDTVMTL